ncbi:MAG: Fur family transcriptional regulator, ferric uptake regulator [Candidatus Cloacimonadota bacterium]|jgi:Fur family ferric uptake transcriptional regulator|nr:Fur family transcriptional regulator, ferric uptake regulator [Candidatus Cloacimonadota bacterium]
MKKEEAIFRDFLKTKGLKLTKPRRIILNAVFSTHEHFNVDALYDIIRKRHKNVSRATIYRTMPLMIEAGLIKQALRCQAKDHYEHIFGHKSHLHFICDKCGKIVEKESKQVEKIIKDLAETEGFEIREFNVGAKGLCADCRS